jgi:hypothetical protein
MAQRGAMDSDLMLVGISVYDMNEYRVAESRAHLVPLAQTLADLRASSADASQYRRLLGQYPMAFVRRLFPTAGYTDKVLVGLRAKARVLLKLPSRAEDEENALVLPSGAVLQFGYSSKKVSDWDIARMVRRLALLRSENGARHAFDGPKQLAFKRMLAWARSRGDVIIVVLPVAQAYADEFLNAEVMARFEAALADAHAVAPEAMLVRLDRAPHLSSHDYFSDLVHLNGAGRQIATDVFLTHVMNAEVRSAGSTAVGWRRVGSNEE